MEEGGQLQELRLQLCSDAERWILEMEKYGIRPTLGFGMILRCSSQVEQVLRQCSKITLRLTGEEGLAKLRRIHSSLLLDKLTLGQQIRFLKETLPLLTAARVVGDVEKETWDVFDNVLQMRNAFMHARETEDDIEENAALWIRYLTVSREMCRTNLVHFLIAAEERRIPMSDIEKARHLFQEAGLAFPTVARELAARLKEKDKWLFSTRELEMSPYNLQHYVGELDGSVLEQCGPVLYQRKTEAKRVADYALLCHSGHGVNSYALQYYLVYGRLALFLHLGWGGVYMDAAKSAAQIRDCFALADAIVPAVEMSQRLPSDSRLTIVGSDFYGSYWARPGESRLSKAAKARQHTLPYGAPGDEDNKRPVEVLTDVLHWLKSPPPNRPLQQTGPA